MPDPLFDDWMARRYATLWPELFDPAVIDPAVDFLTELAGDGAALEFGVGTGRIALPLRRRGIRVHGIELSPAMADQLARNTGHGIDVTIGDFASTKVDKTFKLVYLIRTPSRTCPARTNKSRPSATPPGISSLAAASSSRTTSQSCVAFHQARRCTSSPPPRPI
jgi:Methyltransferase domain